MAAAGPRLWNTAVEWTQLDELRPIEAFKQAGDSACAAAGWTMIRHAAPGAVGALAVPVIEAPSGARTTSWE